MSSSVKKNYWSIFALLLYGTTSFVFGKIKILNGYDPGSCNRRNAGEELLVKDRQGKHQLLFCTKDNGIFGWRKVDGSTPPGEFINPGYDCSSILDEDPEARDGFYWIKVKGKVPKKVWCDMNTDGGGYMLIGRKNSSKTWSVPSNNRPVEPFGFPHWSSAFGRASIMDFRVQMATAEDFKATKAHWSYRLQTKRPLKNLLVLNKGGCGRKSPGIGDIAYVKDLMTDKIVTTKFRCSKFGIGYHPRTKSGWSMMNSCLQKPCPWGFAFHHKFRIQTDYSGAFSYAVDKTISGMENPSTAFVGCDNGHCCGCYGPKAGRKNYCFQECRSKNGGTVTTRVFTWFWVRLALPKRIWKKCMEYKVTKKGVVLWYKFDRESVLPVKGRCGKSEALLYNGIVVVPDNAAAKKIPSVAGLMVYRKDNKELYITENKKWSVIAQEKKIRKMLNKDIAFLKQELENVNRTLGKKLSYAMLLDARITSLSLIGKKRFVDQLTRWLPAGSSWKLCYRASRDGWRSIIFHSRCDNKGPTVTIIRVGVYIFGAYTDQSWGGSSRYRRSTASFIFSFINKYNIKPFKVPVYRSQYAIYTCNGCGPIFGGGHDISIVNNAHTSTNSHTNFGHTYRPPSGYSYGSSNTQALLAGSYQFRPSEVEVFYKR